MANKDPSRTEMPTEKRLEKARKEGNLLVCPDVSSFFLLLIGTVSLFLTVPWLIDAFRNTFKLIWVLDCRENWNDTQILSGTFIGMRVFLKVIAPTTIGLCFFALLVMRFQIGSYFSVETLKWKVDNLWKPQAALRELFPNKTSLMNFFITFMKVFLVGYVIYLTIDSKFDELLQMNLMPLMEGIRWGVRESLILTFKILAAFLVIVLVSYWHKRREYYDNLMMTKQEVRDERKDADGDPLVKAKIRAKMRELFFRSMMGNIKNADLVVTNPTHVAVALRYNPSKDPAPVVIAKGLRKRAQKIKELARMHGVPVTEAPPLARSLYREVKVGSVIPAEFYRAVAAILAKLQRSGKKKILLGIRSTAKQA